MARNPDTQIVADFADARWTLRVDELIPPADEKLECHADFSFRNRASPNYSPPVGFRSLNI
jgi:hypothetical protein